MKVEAGRWDITPTKSAREIVSNEKCIPTSRTTWIAHTKYLDFTCPPHTQNHFPNRNMTNFNSTRLESHILRFGKKRVDFWWSLPAVIAQKINSFIVQVWSNRIRVQSIEIQLLQKKQMWKLVPKYGKLWRGLESIWNYSPCEISCLISKIIEPLFCLLSFCCQVQWHKFFLFLCNIYEMWPFRQLEKQLWWVGKSNTV